MEVYWCKLVVVIVVFFLLCLIVGWYRVEVGGYFVFLDVMRLLGRGFIIVDNYIVFFLINN